jgi:hypothetical protein
VGKAFKILEAILIFREDLRRASDSRCSGGLNGHAIKGTERRMDDANGLVFDHHVLQQKLLIIWFPFKNLHLANMPNSDPSRRVSALV